MGAATCMSSIVLLKVTLTVKLSIVLLPVAIPGWTKELSTTVQETYSFFLARSADMIKLVVS